MKPPTAQSPGQIVLQAKPTVWTLISCRDCGHESQAAAPSLLPSTKGLGEVSWREGSVQDIFPACHRLSAARPLRGWHSLPPDASRLPGGKAQHGGTDLPAGLWLGAARQPPAPTPDSTGHPRGAQLCQQPTALAPVRAG